MTSWLSKLFGWLSAMRPSLTCDADVWRVGTMELNRRTLNERRESGAFLIGRRQGSACHIEEFVFYDDLDPHALTSGIVHFDGNKFTKLWDICRERGLSVVADVHVHPGSYAQSVSDQDQPAIPCAGHIAIILPHFARRSVEPGGIGLYQYLGNKRWRDHTQSGRNFFRLVSP